MSVTQSLEPSAVMPRIVVCEDFVGFAIPPRSEPQASGSLSALTMPFDFGVPTRFRSSLRCVWLIVPTCQARSFIVPGGMETHAGGGLPHRSSLPVHEKARPMSTRR